MNIPDKLAEIFLAVSRAGTNGYNILFKNSFKKFGIKRRHFKKLING